MDTVTQNKSKSKSILEVLEFCQAQNFPARVVGKWIWIKFESKPSADVRQALKDFGFHWAHRRQQWAHNCGRPSKPALNYKPWDKYETTLMENYVNAGLGVV